MAAQLFRIGCFCGFIMVYLRNHRQVLTDIVSQRGVCEKKQIKRRGHGNEQTPGNFEVPWFLWVPDCRVDHRCPTVKPGKVPWTNLVFEGFVSGLLCLLQLHLGQRSQVRSRTHHRPNRTNSKQQFVAHWLRQENSNHTMHNDKLHWHNREKTLSPKWNACLKQRVRFNLSQNFKSNHEFRWNGKQLDADCQMPGQLETFIKKKQLHGSKLQTQPSITAAPPKAFSQPPE